MAGLTPANPLTTPLVFDTPRVTQNRAVAHRPQVHSSLSVEITSTVIDLTDSKETIAGVIQTQTMMVWVTEEDEQKFWDEVSASSGSRYSDDELSDETPQTRDKGAGHPATSSASTATPWLTSPLPAPSRKVLTTPPSRDPASLRIWTLVERAKLRHQEIERRQQILLQDMKIRSDRWLIVKEFEDEPADVEQMDDLWRKHEHERFHEARFGDDTECLICHPEVRQEPIYEELIFPSLLSPPTYEAPWLHDTPPLIFVYDEGGYVIDHHNLEYGGYIAPSNPLVATSSVLYVDPWLLRAPTQEEANQWLSDVRAEQEWQEQAASIAEIAGLEEVQYFDGNNAVQYYQPLQPCGVQEYAVNLPAIRVVDFDGPCTSQTINTDDEESFSESSSPSSPPSLLNDSDGDYSTDRSSCPPTPDIGALELREDDTFTQADFDLQRPHSASAILDGVFRKKIERLTRIGDGISNLTL